mmetsp:Transcript_17571/g.48523  ORF Transcript_17571/g.48523 Transcript_17571/m.48523 type:complete len:282 (+) Transcript_17571:303-1148(+)|eukprot:CAMPEP_0172367114 /NCGR_PEP_ID=MMETSP1060-20121228/19234_1 /TAXON_ID=37318 /ORGANISM="Pseudo-nitzschia pungens, Strain cf. cingulata" /LENGTH=281 /DNA_ID=CAMNT_0013091231 /DNA_START=274 /DNA_END=1119 /DNA_ORIENTATION=+
MTLVGFAHSTTPLRSSWLRQLFSIADRTADRSTCCRKMSSGFTRAAAAATSRDVKQKLVNLLFREQYSRTGPEGHKRLDFSIYSYKDLRQAYLKRLQVIHPDKFNSKHSDDVHCERKDQSVQKTGVEETSVENLKKEFQELQSTWDRYEELSKSMMKVRGDGVAANFTQFGVGCSFSDNEEESALRREITDQACRGWFSSGLVSSGLGNENDDNGNRKDETAKGSCLSSEGVGSKQKPLIDDAMFVRVESPVSSVMSDASNLAGKRDGSRRRRKTLIPGIN